MTLNSGVIVRLLNSKLQVFIASILRALIATRLVPRKLVIEDFAPTGVNATVILMGEQEVAFLVILLLICEFIGIPDTNGFFRFPLCTCPEGFTGLHCEFHMSSDVVNPYVVSSNDEGGLGAFGLIAVVVSAVVVATGIAAILRYHPYKRTENTYSENEDSNTWKSHVAGAGVRTVEVL
jgi:hypothetical protein